MILRISKGATINLTNYESARVDLTLEGAISDDNEPTVAQEIKDDLMRTLNAWLQDEVLRIQSEAGLPPASPKRFTG